MYLHFVPLIIQWLFPRYTWRRKVGAQKKIFLTFDDGPVPEITPFVLEVLNRYKVKATFFCVGDNVKKYPAIFQQLLQAGHRIGNHTFHHLNGNKTSTKAYIENVKECDKALNQVSEYVPRLFRPPYGRIGSKQASALLNDYEIIMWDVLSADYDQSLSPEECLAKSIRYTRAGSIVVFHDNPKAYKNLSWVLPRYLDYFLTRGYTFEVL